MAHVSVSIQQINLPTLIKASTSEELVELIRQRMLDGNLMNPYFISETAAIVYESVTVEVSNTNTLKYKIKEV